MSKEVAEEYASSLSDLTVNSKPLINMLTILAEENIAHAGVIVETVEKHLEKVQPDIKLPVLYLVDSIIKNVGGAYTQKFSQSIVNMFTRTFKQVDEKIRSQMFKLRETWHDVFPATKLYQLDVKVNVIDPAWPIQAQPHQSNIHPVATTSAPPAAPVEEDKMRDILKKKEQELLMLRQKKIEMELEQTRKQLELTEKNIKTKPVTSIVPPMAPSMPVAMVNPVVTPVIVPDASHIPVKQRLGPPVNKSTAGRIAPVSGALAGARRDPRLARLLPAPAPAPAAAPAPPIASHVFDIKPLERVTKRKTAISIDVRPDTTARRDPRLHKRNDKRDKPKRKVDEKLENDKANEYINKLHLADPKKINKLPPIPKINREEKDKVANAPPSKKRKEIKRNSGSSGKDSASSSPEKKPKANNVRKNKNKKQEEVEEKSTEPEVVTFKELKNYHKERYMRRNKEKSESPEVAQPEEHKLADIESTNSVEVPDTKDVDLRVLATVVEANPAPIVQKRPSTENLEGKSKKLKQDKFDILFGNEDVDLRQLPQVDEITAPPPPSITESPKAEVDDPPAESPKKDWSEVKEKSEENKSKTLSKLDLVRAKLAEATKTKDMLGRTRPSVERERRRTLDSEDTDLRMENADEFDADDHKKTISIIMSQAKEQYDDGKLDRSQYNTLMYQVLQLNEKLKLKEAKQRESLENSKRKLKAQFKDENHKVISPKSSPNAQNFFGDIDERVNPAVFLDTPPDSQPFMQDSDMRVPPSIANDVLDPTKVGLLPPPPNMPIFMPNFQVPWRGQPRPGIEDFSARNFRPNGQFFRGKFDKRGGRLPFEPRMAIPPMPAPQVGMFQGECPVEMYQRSVSPLPLGVTGIVVPPTDFKLLEYIDQDPVKTIQIDGVPREIRFYGETAIIMLDWDDPREIKFLPGCRRVTFDNKDSVVLNFNEGYKQVEIDDQVFDIRFGAPTRELYINGRWFECFFGGQPFGVVIDGKPRLVHLEGPLPQVDIGKEKRTDLVAGKINLIVNATQMCPVFLDAKVQKFMINGRFFTIRFADSLRTVLINEQPFKVEYGDLPKPLFVGNEKFFIRFSALPRNIKPGQVQIANMEGSLGTLPVPSVLPQFDMGAAHPMETDQQRPFFNKSPSPDAERKGLDMLASVMPSSVHTPASASEYSLAEPIFTKTDKIPGLEISPEKPASVPVLGNINVTDLFAKLVATGIVALPNTNNNEVQQDTKKEEAKPKEDKTVIHKVDLLKSETLRVAQPGVVARLYGGMQCSGCGARFPPEHTVRYSQHLDWHFRQNRRERDSARRAHSRRWHYELADWLQYEELEDLDDREKSWFEKGETEGENEIQLEPAAEAPSVAAGAPADHFCALCGDKFDQFYNEDKEEWHLRNSVRHEEQNYHPLCFEDYKASLNKEELKEETKPETVVEEKIEDEAIEIKDVDETLDQSDNESVVEVVEPEAEQPEPLEIDEEEETPIDAEEEDDDVVLKTEPVVQVEVSDSDTDDETVAERAERDERAAIDFAKVKVKQEPIDPDDEPVITAEEQAAPMTFSAARTGVHSSIDGNVQLEAAPAPPALAAAIRINISKPMPAVIAPAHTDPRDDADDEPAPPGEEPQLHYKLKPTLEGVHFSRQPPVMKGNELSGLCSIM